MKTQRYQLAALVVLLCFQGFAKGQARPKYTYVEIDDIFARAASQKSSQVTAVESQRFGRDIESKVGMQKDAERKTADLLLDFEKSANPETRVKSADDTALKGERKLVRADILLNEYALELIRANAMRDPQKGPDAAFLTSYVKNQLREMSVQQDLLVYVDKEIGSASDRAGKTLNLLVALDMALSAEKQTTIVVAIRNGNATAVAALNLPPPLCIIFRTCRPS